MPYFFILPGVVIYVAVMCLVLLATLVYPPAAKLRPLLGAVLVCSVIGFVVSTVVYAIVSVLTVKSLDGALSGRPSAIGRVVIGGVIFVGPFVAAIAGLGGGAVFALLRQRRKGRA